MKKILNLFKNLMKKSAFIVSVYDYIIQFYYKHCFSDASRIKSLFRKEIGREVELENPVEFSDKMQWLKLNWYDPIAVKCADKYKVRNFVKEKVGSEILNEVYGVYESIDEIDISELPKSFILKGTHGSGYNLVCHDKELMDWNKEFKKMKGWFKSNYFWKYREWVYKDIQPRIICEKYLSDEEQSMGLNDYKIYCFNGEPRYCQVIGERDTGGTIDFFDTEWNHMEFTGLQRMPHSVEKISKPEKYEEMLEFSKKLSKDFPFVRVDFYYVNKEIYFGELTFFPRSGFGTFDPPEWNEKIGNLLKLPSSSLSD